MRYKRIVCIFNNEKKKNSQESQEVRDGKSQAVFVRKHWFYSIPQLHFSSLIVFPPPTLPK